MGRIQSRLDELGIQIPKSAPPLANYVPAKRVGNLVYTAGQAPRTAETEYKGKLGAGLSIEQGQAAVRLCVLNNLAAILSVIDSLDQIKQVVAVHGFVNSAPDFTGQAVVMNGASDLVVEIFGEPGKHTRTAIGVAALPMDFTASVWMIVEVE